FIGLILFPLPSVRVLGFTLLFTALGGFGTTVCYHRMLAHRTLKLNKVVEHLLVFCAMFNGSGAPASWVAYHRHHHSRTDTPEDISSPKQGGFWWAHLRWLYQSAPADTKRWCPELTTGAYKYWQYAQVPVILLSLVCGLALGLATHLTRPLALQPTRFLPLPGQMRRSAPLVASFHAGWSVSSVQCYWLSFARSSPSTMGQAFSGPANER